ncbi:hypothetical protein [Candidatus Merdisoma sp. JLR.KK006]|uniref:AMP-binding enzyme n=1 Tax=Candidatus Merdisoma sp. JLR.KK006 TaxID=3112626 RepID=UPI002FF0D5C7
MALTSPSAVPLPTRSSTFWSQTGDLGRWRADGEIEYLERIDTQVKLRGLRIELSEIESAMAAFPGIRLVAVTDGREENGRQYLTGYYTAEKVIEEKELRSHLAARLPRYMVPNYFVHLTDMPMTPSGKTDRKNLPKPDLTAQEREYIAPRTKPSKSFAAFWKRFFLLSWRRSGMIF